VIDVPRLRNALARARELSRYDLIVGHLAHLLPVKRVIVLRCHPLELRARLRRARRGTSAERHANLVAEATDVVLVEALAAGRHVTQIDTTGRSTASVAREVLRRWKAPHWSRGTPVDWLSDPSVTEHLLDGSR
jgi:adenylate kinase